MAKNKQKLSKAATARIAGYETKSTLVSGRSQVRKKDNLLAFAVVAASLAVAIGAQLLYFGFGLGKPTTPAAPTVAPSETVAEARVWTGSMNLGSSPVEFELYGDKAPKAVANFVTLTKSGFFNSTGCHRLTTEGIYVLQCGDPNGDGTGGPGYNFGPIENAPQGDLYSEGVIAMARTGDNAQSMGSQFFIVYKDSTIPSDSAGGYTVLGKVTKNVNTVTKIAALGTADGSGDGKPKNPIQLSAVTVK